MNKIIQMKATYFISAILTTGLFLIIGCNKEIVGRTDDIAALRPANIDLNAGTWKTILLGRPDTFAVSTPAPVNGSAYIAELNEIKGLQQNISSSQRAIIKYWSAGSVLRWNEIMRELVAKYNLPPYQNPDGTYPAPNSNNPFAYP